MRIEMVLVGLFCVATAVALLARRLRIPYTVALVVAGLCLGPAHILEPPALSKDLLYAVFLPGLIFEAAFAIEWAQFRDNRWTIAALALPGLVVAILLTALVLVPAVNTLHFVDGFTFASGLVFASVIAATDPVAVVGLFKSVGAPRRLRVLMEGESLLNDGTAIVLFTLVLAFVTGRHFSAAQAALDFLRIVGMGVVLGALVGYAASAVIHRVDDPMLEITLTTIAAYGSFVAAEQLHYSGVIATVTAGMLCGNTAARTGMSPSTRVAVAAFWEYASFALNSLVFLLIGFRVQFGELLAAWQPIVAAYLAVTLGRVAVIALVSYLLSWSKERISARWAAVLSWGGLRGSLSMVLVLGLPLALPHRGMIITMAFGVVVLSILVQGLTMKPLLGRLGLLDSGSRAVYERLRGAARGNRAALKEIEAMRADSAVSAAIAQKLASEFSARLAQTERELSEMNAREESLGVEERRLALRRALVAEKDAITAAFHSGQLGDESHDALRKEVDRRLLETDID